MNPIKTLNENEWIINGKVYDLTTWINYHPGGKTILNANRQRDCTELFETYHLMSSNETYINRQLSKYFIRNAQTNEITNLYDWNDPLYIEMKKELKTKIKSYFNENNMSYKAD
eukprot:303097_1